MSEINKVYHKYPNWDIIEFKYSDTRKAIDWITGEIDKTPMLHWDPDKHVVALKRMIEANEGFVKFLNKAVIININDNLRGPKDPDIFNYYVYEFVDEGLLLSLILGDPTDNHQLKTCAKCLMRPNMTIEMKDFNRALYSSHYRYYGAVPGKDWDKESYLESIIHMQMMMVLTINAYLVLHEKEILISKIEQKRELKPGTKAGPRRSKASLFYRYSVTIPKNYKPRKFDANYIAEQWSRRGHLHHCWALIENAEKIAKKLKGGKVIHNRVKDGKVLISYTREPQTVKRKKGNPYRNLKKTYE